jgi:hypothetical protein
MTTVPRGAIEEVWNRLCNLDHNQSEKLIKQFFGAQPALGIYLAAQQDNLGKDAEDSPMIELSIAVWQTTTQIAGCPLHTVSPEAIDAAEERNSQNLEMLGEGSEFDWQSYVRTTIEDYNQRELLGFGVEVLMARYEEEPDLAPESVGLEMLCLKTVIDSLDQQEGT